MSYKLKNIKYNIHIEVNEQFKTNKLTNYIFDLYNNYTIEHINLSEDRTEIFNTKSNDKGGIVGKSASYAEPGGGIKTKHFPPKGPIPHGTYCAFCNAFGPEFHLEDCSGPYDKFYLTEYGITDIYADIILETYTQDQLLNILQNDGLIEYRNIINKRGVQVIESTSDKIGNFNNMFCCTYNTKTINDLENFYNTYPEGTNFHIKVSKDLNVSVAKVPIKIINENKIKDIIQKLLRKCTKNNELTLDNDKCYISSFDCIYKIFENSRTRLNLEELYKKITRLDITGFEFHEIKSQNGAIYIHYKSDKYKLKASIKSGGSIEIFLSYDEGKKDKKDIDYQLFTTISNKIIQFVDNADFYEVLVSKVLLKEDSKIMNIAIPYEVTNGKFKYLHKVQSIQFPPQTGASDCKNRGMDVASYNGNIDINKPFPFSFSGEAPCRYKVLTTQGKKIKSGKKLLGNREFLYEPCCHKLIGTLPKNISNMLTLRDFNVYTRNDIKFIKNKLVNVTDTPDQLKDKYKNIIDSITGSKTKNDLIRKTIFGFPNNIFPEDSVDFNDVKSGIEVVPDLGSSQDMTKQEISIDQTKQVTQPDIHSSIYVPGTQLHNYKGDNTFKRDSRIFKGLIDFANETKYNKNILIDLVKKTLLKNNLDITLKVTNHLIPVNGINLLDDITINYFIIVPNECYRTEETNPKTGDKYDYFKNMYTDEKYIIGLRKQGEQEYKYTNYPKSVDGYNIPIKNVNDYSMEKLIETYFDKLIDNKLIMITSEQKLYNWYQNIEVECAKTDYIYLKVEKDVTVPDNTLIKLKFPGGNEYLNQDNSGLSMYTYKNKDYMFIPKVLVKKLENNVVYKFAFNYYIINGNVNLMKFQSLLPIVGEKVDPKDIMDKDTILNKIFNVSFIYKPDQ